MIMTENDLKQIEAYNREFESVVTDEDRENIQALRQKYDLCSVSNLLEKYAGIIVRLERQFSGEEWLPSVIHRYVAIADELSIKHDWTYELFAYNNWDPLIDIAHTDDPENRAYSKVGFKKLAFAKFPYMSNRSMEALWDCVRSEYENKSDYYAAYFSVLSHSEYTACRDIDPNSQELITVFYPKDDYTEAFIRDDFYPKYHKAAEDERQAYQNYEDAFKGWLKDIQSRMKFFTEKED